MVLGASLGDVVTDWLGVGREDLLYRLSKVKTALFGLSVSPLPVNSSLLLGNTSLDSFDSLDSLGGGGGGVNTTLGDALHDLRWDTRVSATVLAGSCKSPLGIGAAVEEVVELVVLGFTCPS